MNTDDPVVLHSAYRWDCPKCGRRDIYGNMVDAELNDAQKAELGKMMGMDDGEEWKGTDPDAEFILENGLVTMPDTVTCPDCGEAFPVFCEPETRMPKGFDPRRDL